MAAASSPRLLVIGGTSFVGRALIELAVSREYRVTMFNRGVTNPGLFPEVDHRVGDRDGGLAALGDDRWDVVVDTCGYVPRVVRDSAALLQSRVGWYSLVSSLAVYADFGARGIDEDAPLAPPPDPPSEDMALHYGPLKAQCEGVVAELYPRRSTMTRCSIIVGPNDPTHRFSYWIARAVEGGTMLAPGDPAQTVQFIDARDLAAWLLDSAEHGAAGAFNAAGPREPLTMREFLEMCAGASRSDVRFEWRDDEFMLAHGLAPYFAPPMWVPTTGPMAGLAAADSSRAIASGLRFRPAVETIHDTYQWWRQEAKDVPLAWPRAEEARVLGA
ncbi:MAG: NAD-dependent epimerase/dehydratase family protein [Acidimicrobiia bacterium]